MEEVQCQQQRLHHEEYDAMAVPEQVERLKHSVREWNQWRQDHPNLRPDLSGANLSSADLRRADLNKTDLSEVFLSGTTLSGADLSGADLSLADLSGATLSGADLHVANLSNAILEGTDLNSTNLSSAILDGADLNSATLGFAFFNFADLNRVILTQARFFYTTFANVDLSNTTGLATVIHYGRSFVDVNTVTLPHDEHTRLHFLRGVGFTETQIEYLPSLLTPRPIEYSSLFISYAHQDEVIAKRLYTDLRNKDVPCWFAPHDLRPGTPILCGLEEAIHLQDKFLLILSKHAVNSAWIEREVDAALHQEIKRGRDVLFPIRLDNAILQSNAGWATRLQHRHIGNFTNFQDDAAYNQAFTTLLRHLKIAKPPTASP
jgi:uncharacterized protein YjbI with pentapeptide repeats